MADHSGRAGRPLPADSLESRCAAHAPVSSGGSFRAGAVFGDWRVTAFIGRGGNGEVYCAEHVRLGTPAAVKVLMRNDERAKERFAREAKMLAKMKSKSFPRFFAYGETNPPTQSCGAINRTAYIAMELLEPGGLPKGDRAVAKFMLKVSEAVGELHDLGYIHRDIKPSNILWRMGGSHPGATAIPVLADLGLVKEIKTATHKLATHNSQTLTLAGVGTPGYGAPEQMERGEVTTASDIHALGVLADRCFDGKPPSAWKRIIERATSSIPDRRYSSVAVFSRAVRHRHLRRRVSAWLCTIVVVLVGGIFLKEPAARAWMQWREWQNAPVLDASATLGGVEVGDARWFLDDLPVDMPHHFVQLSRGNRRWCSSRLCAVVHRNGKTYSAKRTDVTSREWTGVKKLSLALREDPPDGTSIKVYAHDGTPFEFVWCEPNDAADDRSGFWIASKRLSGKQAESIMRTNPDLRSSIIYHRHDLASDSPATFCKVLDASLDGMDFRLEAPDFRQWRLGKRLYADFSPEMPEWAGMPPSRNGDGRTDFGWMRMDGTGREECIDSSVHNSQWRRPSACVRYLGVSRFWHEANTVAYRTAISLLRFKQASDVARGEAMMKSFFLSDDHALKMTAMEFCLKHGMATLDDLGGIHADVNLRYIAACYGDANILERLAVDDPDPGVRKRAYGSIRNPPPMVSARYIAQIRAEDGPEDIAKSVNVIRSMIDRKSLDFIVEHSLLRVLRGEASNRLKMLSGK